MHTFTNVYVCMCIKKYICAAAAAVMYEKIIHAFCIILEFVFFFFSRQQLLTLHSLLWHLLWGWAVSFSSFIFLFSFFRNTIKFIAFLGSYIYVYLVKYSCIFVSICMYVPLYIYTHIFISIKHLSFGHFAQIKLFSQDPKQKRCITKKM